MITHNEGQNICKWIKEKKKSHYTARVDAMDRWAIDEITLRRSPCSLIHLHPHVFTLSSDYRIKSFPPLYVIFTSYYL